VLWQRAHICAVDPESLTGENAIGLSQLRTIRALMEFKIFSV
jgi:hypothetical protein